MPKPTPKSKGDALADDAFDSSKKDVDLAKAIKELSPEEAAYFLARLEAGYRKRKIQLTGYLVALASFVLTLIGAFVYAAMVETFPIWVFLVPFFCLGLTIYVFGRWSEKVGSLTPPKPSKPSNPSNPSNPSVAQ